MNQDLTNSYHTVTEEQEVFVFPTSFAQQRLWFLNQLALNNPFYNVSAALRFTGSLNLTALEQAFNEIVRRHETLRTTFVIVDGQPSQAIAPTLTIPLCVINLRDLPPKEREIEARRLAIEEAKRPFDLATGPLLRVNLLQLDETEYVLLLNLHHIVADGWSIGVLIRELAELYAAFIKNLPSTLPELPIQYADFAQWQHEWLQGEILETQLSYWRSHLKDISILNLPTDKPRPAVQTFQGKSQDLTLSKSLTQALEDLSQKQGVTLFMTLLAAFQTLLYRYTQQDDIVVGSPIANRNRREIEGLIGFFVNSLVLRVNLGGQPTFLSLLEQVKEVTLGAYAHQDLPFEKLVEALHPERDLSRNPIFQVSFTLQNTPVESLELPELTLSLLEFDSEIAKLDLEFHLWQDYESLKGKIIYSTDLFDCVTISRTIGHFQTLLESIIANPEQRISELSILTDAERHQLLFEFNHHPENSQFKIKPYFHQLFEQQAKRSPNQIAIVFENQRLTYRELNTKANQLARYLQQLGVSPDALVGICLDRSLEMIVGLLGILKAGGAYLPLDPAYPQERLNFMLEGGERGDKGDKEDKGEGGDKGEERKEDRVSIILTNSSLATLFEGNERDINLVCVDKDWAKIAQFSNENPNSIITPENLAYVIYTSGSTGKPKGVLIQHGGLSNLIEAQKQTFNIQPNHRILQFASLSFDASIFEIVMALGTGATLYLAKKESLLPGKELIQLLRDRAITHITLPPAVLAVLPTETFPDLQTIIAAGESLSKEIINRWARNYQFFNAYGPTEATVWSTIAQISDRDRKISIGSPILNTKIYILDSQLQLVPIGIPGELYISGEGIARGYLNRPDLTAERFIPNPFDRNSRLYKTGDLACYLPNGEIEFLGRIDRQVKLRGFRIELGEIEAVLRQHPAVKEVILILTAEGLENNRLVAYVVPNQQQLNLKLSDLRAFLKDKLPKYMVPSGFIFLDALPLTPNGKIDLRALTTIAPSNPEKTFVSPNNATEEAIAKIWSKVLNLEQVSIDDNFFDLGGNSLLAIRLIAQINQHLHQNLPLSTLFLNPTVAGIASHLYSDVDSLLWSPLVAIQPVGSQPPFFCVHPIFGVVFPYYELASHLGKDRPFYGLQPLGIDGKSAPFTRIEDMAAYYIEAIRKVQPRGPYFLGGWSFGCLIAFEMAQQLLKAGEQVGLLALLDNHAPIPANKPTVWESFKFLFTTVAPYILPFALDYFHLAIALFKSKNKKSKKQLLNELAIRSMLRIYYANCQATLNYLPQTYPGKITLFKSNQNRTKTERDLTMGWRYLTTEQVEIHLVPGNHLTMLRKPNVQILTEQLNQAMSETKIF